MSTSQPRGEGRGLASSFEADRGHGQRARTRQMKGDMEEKDRQGDLAWARRSSAGACMCREISRAVIRKMVPTCWMRSGYRGEMNRQTRAGQHGGSWSRRSA